MLRGDQINSQLPTPNSQAVLVALLTLWAGASIDAHRLDEYLQAVRVDLDLTRVEVRLALTPGVDVSDTIVREIDADHDGRLAQAEQAAYVSRVLDAVHVDVDGTAVGLRPMSSNFPALTDLQGGEGTISIQAGAWIPRLPPGRHRVHLVNRFHADIGAYLANALVPHTARLEITAQRRSADQSDLTIDYVVRQSAN